VIFPSKTITAVVGGLYDHPSGRAWLGTDNVGHDVFANLMYGTRTSLIVGLLAGAVAVLVGVLIGTVAGYVGGALDEALMGFTNVVIAIPQFVVLILISIALHSRSATGVALVIAVTAWPWTARAVRAQAASIRVREHLDIARLSGSGTSGMIMYDVIPYMLSYICMAFVLQMSSAILTEAAMSLLGLGPSNGVSLGIMLHWSLDWESIRTGAWWAFVPPTVFLTLIAFALLMLQTSLDEVFNPRLRRGTLRRWVAKSAGAPPSIGGPGTGTGAPVIGVPGTGPPAEVPVQTGAMSSLERGTA
jgi:peptide/nickel transport system permease protein